VVSRPMRHGYVPGHMEHDPACDVRLTLPARAENVVLVRHVVGALAEALRMPPHLIDDVKLAVTEACTNVVRHAYAGREGPLEVHLEPEDGDCMTIVVTDRGQGIRPSPSEGGPGLGLPLIAALAHQLEIEHEPDRGSRVSMRFRAGGSVPGA
jgi:serine/threonine-protein kinase RsbW